MGKVSSEDFQGAVSGFTFAQLHYQVQVNSSKKVRSTDDTTQFAVQERLK